MSAAGGVISVGGAVAQAWGVANGAAAALAVMNANAAGGGAHADDHATSPFGEGPEVSAIRETDAQGAGILASPQHHIFPQSEREFFEQRGFVGANDIDNFTVELDRSTHEAIHTGRGVNPSGGWPGEWNDTLMTRLADTEARLGRNLTFDEIMTIGIQTLERYGLHGPIVPYR